MYYSYSGCRLMIQAAFGAVLTVVSEPRHGGVESRHKD